MARTYVVTGAASGIGAAIKAHLEEQGELVVGVDIQPADVVADLSTPEGRTAMLHEVRQLTKGVVDAVIACAGVSAGPVVQVNYFGAVATLEGLHAMLLLGSHPRAVVVASSSVANPSDDALVGACLAGDEAGAVALSEMIDSSQSYLASKRAIARWVRRVAATPSWAGASIPINAVAPGVILTPMTDPILKDPYFRAFMDSMVPMPLHGYGAVEDVVPLLAWLAGPENNLVTGQCIFIDGGADVVLRGDDIW